MAPGSLAADEDTPTISVNGTAVVRTTPDQVRLVFGIDSREKKLDAVVENNDRRVASVVKFLTDSGIKPEFISTELIRIRPVYPNRDRLGKQVIVGQGNLPANFSPESALPKDDKKPDTLKPIGYTAKRKMAVKIKDLKKFDLIYRGIIKNGVNEIEGIYFDSSREIELKSEVRLKAVRAARKKAEAMARELDCRLSGVQSISEGQTYSPFSNVGFNDISNQLNGGSGELSVGTIEIRVTVLVVFRLGSTDFE